MYKNLLRFRTTNNALRPDLIKGAVFRQQPAFSQHRLVSISSVTLHHSFVFREDFANRHIGITPADEKVMLEKINVKSIDELIANTVPQDICLNRTMKLKEALTETEFLAYAKHVASFNEVYRSYIGMGYYNCHVPTVIQRNIFENPGWITQYTPYQAEFSQGRLESLINFQTMICDLTGLEIANASLLDEATASAEAMAMCLRNTKRKLFYVSDKLHPQSIDVIKTRAEAFNIKVEVMPLADMDFSGQNVSGFIFQYPDTEGSIVNVEDIIADAKKNGTVTICAADLLSLTLLKSPHEIGVDIALGSAQRFGVSLGYGGPHAAFLACSGAFKREIPGRIIGASRDSNNKTAYRLCLQTREQHIRGEKANSNICTAQALLANMAAFFAIYHGPEGLKKKANHIHGHTLVLAEGLKKSGNVILNDYFFDTIKIKPVESIASIKQRALLKKINLRYFDDNIHVGISMDETVSAVDVSDLLSIFKCDENFDTVILRTGCVDNLKNSINHSEFKFKRISKFLQHEVFNSYHSETLLLRYMKKLENKDLSLVHSMIPLGSCTMKLNGTTEMMPCSWPEFANIHPFVPRDQVKGYHHLFDELSADLCEITGYDKISLQPNSGAQGEYAGLRAIKKYFESINQSERNICLIPASAHGTNTASAAMAGMKIHMLKVHKNGLIDLEHLKELSEKYSKTLACAMVTYPSTYGVFDAKIVDFCDIVHKNGGQVYLDGANLNAQVGLCRPGDYGSDVSHLNLHKTFCIPHGGGGPGMGPIGVKKHLAPFLPSHSIMDVDDVSSEKSFGAVSAAPWGSASILPISWAYIKMMGSKGLTRATQIAILNANYMMTRLQDVYVVNYKGKGGHCAHEFIVNADFKASANIEAVDISKRLQDYGLHSPTLSWPVHGALMIEPTESESKEELDRLCDALINIRKEITKIESGEWDRKNNPLKNAPHTQEQCISDSWNKPYDRQIAAYPLDSIKPESKMWPTCGRVDDSYGDKHLVVKWSK